jgi:hypothetical protein
MLIYTFDNEGYFIGTGYAQKNPLKEGYIYPKNSTIEALPSIILEAYQSFKFDGVNWAVDNVQYKIDDLLATTNDKGSLLYESDIDGLPITRDTSIDDVEADKTLLRQAAHEAMQLDIYNELEILYLSRSSDTATAASITWDLMENMPSEYSSMGLKSEYTLVGISVGDVLDSEAKILDYATQLNSKKITYSKYRLSRIEQFKSEIAAIG